ncbi:MAG TPA: SPOR domain-containing protein [Steroidobacteraceae bacterium]|nr:SPOR domain-containing protein [Steroidobacteraceae bacterium]
MAASAVLGFRGFAPIVDTLVKERLTGAIILVGLIVALVPELLNGPIRPAPRAHGPGPSTEEPPLRSYTINLADEAHGGGAIAQPQPSGAPAPVAPAGEPAVPSPAAPTSTPPPTVVPQPSTPQHATPPAPATPAAAATEHKAPVASAPSATATSAPASASGWVVQLGSFANRSNAERLAQQVRVLGFPVSVSRGSTGRRLYRVQAGPTHERAAAEQMAAKLHAAGHAGSVLPK